MPKLDKTGPQGLGSMTGRKLGNCSNQSASECSPNNPARGGCGQGCGLGRGNRGQGGGFRGRCRRWFNRFTMKQGND